MPLLQVVPADPMKDDRSLAKLVSDEVKPTKTAAAVEDPTLLALTSPVPPVSPKASADSLLVGVWRSCQNPQSMAVFWISSWNRCVIGSHGFVARGIGIYRSVRWLVVSSCCVECGRSQALRVCVQLCLLTSYLRDFTFIWLWQLSSHPCHSLGGPRSDCKPSSGIQSLLGFPGWREGAVLCRLSPKGLW